MKAPNLRDRIDGEALLAEITKLVGQIVSGWVPVYPQPDIDAIRANPNATPADYRPVEYAPVDKEQLARLQSALAVHMKLLNKVLPDLKALDLTAVVSEQHQALDERDLAQRLSFLRALSGLNDKTTPKRLN
jgi:hypothetical protein